MLGLHDQVNLLLFESSDFVSPGMARIDGRRLRQLTDTIHSEPGKVCKAGVRNGKLGSAEVLSIDGCTAEFLFTESKEPPPPLDVVLVAALPRPQSFSKVLHCAVTMGVKRLYFIHTFKVEKSYWQASRIAPESVADEVTLALEQCCDTVPPQIEFRRRFKPFVEDELPGLLTGRTGYYGHPAATSTLAETGRLPALLAVGPEGGFTEYENSRLAEAGLIGVTLGPRVLRTEFAVAALLARLA